MAVEKNSLGRRSFIKSSILAGGGLILGFSWLGSAQAQAVQNAEVVDALSEINAYLKIARDGTITILSPNPEGGQNIKTSMPMIVAEELDVDWKNVIVEQAPLNTSLYNRQYMGGSNSLRSSWNNLRTAGASARYMLIEAAARNWNVPVEEISTKAGILYHKKSGKSANYGDMASEAGGIPVPENVKLKEINDFKLIGKSLKNVDGEKIVTGKSLFGSDIRKDGMLIAMIIHPPAFGLKLKSFEYSEAKNMPGIKDVFSIKVLDEDYVREHFDTVTFNEIIVVVGNSTWEVMQAKESVKVEWENAPDHTITRNDYYAGIQKVNIPSGLENTSDHKLKMEKMAALPGQILRKDGDPESAFKNASKIIERTYTGPFLAHNNMEPMTFFADVTADKARLAGPLQKPALTAQALAKRLNIPLENIDIQMTRMGGGFGRRSYAHWLIEAALISKKVKAPVKLTYSREDDMTGGIYRPSYRITYKAALDKDNNMIAYHVKAGGVPSSPLNNPNLYPAGTVENYLAEIWSVETNITEGSYRAPRSNFNAFAEESFLDEVAEAAGKDPIKFRLELLERAQKNPVGEINNYDAKRYSDVLKLIQEKSGWENTDTGIHRGVAAYYSHGSYVAHVIDLKIENGKPVTTRVCAAADCGLVINPDATINQIEGSIVDGIGVAMNGALTFTNGVPDQNNFDSYDMIRIGDTPLSIDVHFVKNGVSPTGMGEPAFPPVIGALANALYKATGKRFYDQPFKNNL